MDSQTVYRSRLPLFNYLRELFGLEVPEVELAETAGLVVREMKHAVELSVPLEVEVKIGRSWGELRKLGDPRVNQ